MLTISCNMTKTFEFDSVLNLIVFVFTLIFVCRCPLIWFSLLFSSFIPLIILWFWFFPLYFFFFPYFLSIDFYDSQAFGILPLSFFSLQSSSSSPIVTHLLFKYKHLRNDFNWNWTFTFIPYNLSNEDQIYIVWIRRQRILFDQIQIVHLV